jgi:zinc-ribbon domain
MIFCGQCGYQLSPGETTCPRCGAKTDADQLEHDPGNNKPTEISHALLDLPQASPGRNNQQGSSVRQTPSGPQPLVLGASSYDAQLANETTTMMNSQTYPPQQPSYVGYPQQVGTGFYGSQAGGYAPQYQGGQSPVMAEMLESSNRGKTGALLLILFGLLLLTGSIVVLLLTLQGIIFTA